jgi:type II secretory pathway component GspD/PulD (secretin)
METRIFAVDYVPTRRVARRELSASATGPGRELAPVPPEGPAAPRVAVGTPVDGSWTQIVASEDGDLFQELAVGVRMLLSEQGKFNLDRKAALLQVTDLPDRLEKVAFYLDAVQTRVQRQVQIQALVIEVGLRDEFTSGIDWPALLRDMGASAGAEAAPTPTDGLALDLRVSNVDDLLRALSNQGTVTVMSNPRVVAMNSEPVVMRVGTRDIFFVTTSQMDAAGRLLQTTLTPQVVTEGLVLTVTPQISAGGIINMSINPSVTARTGEVTSRLGDTVPVVSVRETDTMVRVRQGETVVISGLMLERRSRPGSLPTAERPAGMRYGPSRPAARAPETGRQPSKTDLIILLTPTVVTPRARGATQG